MKQTTDSLNTHCRILAVDDEAEVRNAYLHALTFDKQELEASIQDVFNSTNSSTAPQQSRALISLSQNRASRLLR